MDARVYTHTYRSSERQAYLRNRIASISSGHPTDSGIVNRAPPHSGVSMRRALFELLREGDQGNFIRYPEQNESA
jgi:hypothetical protein